ncbi:hypothetical protein KKG45_05405, partial [bacterium]|nr:hypothetical protein [bacterium]
TMVASADMSYPTNLIAFDITEVADGTYQAYGYLDDDGTGDGGATAGDFENTVCVEVTVSDQEDVTGVSITFDSKCPS